MRTLIRCDQVFERLTRGPFPAEQFAAGDSSVDQQVELHLQACHECRQLAEALRPAAQLFHETMDAPQCHDLPVYQGALPVPAQLSSETPTRLREQRRFPQPLAKPNRRSTMFAGTLAQLVRLSAALLLITAAVSTAALIGPLGKSARCAPLATDGQQGLLAETMAVLRLPASCVGRQASSLRDACCTGCHTVSLAQAVPVGLHTARNCQLCHQ